MPDEFGEDEITSNGETLTEFCNTDNLRITNAFYKHKGIHKYTWYQYARQLKPITESIITKQNSLVKLLNVRIQRGAQYG